MTFPRPYGVFFRILIAAGLCIGYLAGDSRAAEFRYNFSGPVPHPALKVYGKDCNRYVKGESGGFRITLPADREQRTVVGVSPVFSVAGDFEITFGFEILKAVSEESAQVGVNVRLMAGKPAKQVADMGHYHGTGEFDVFVAKHTLDFDKDERQEDTEVVPTKARSGRLRLERKGTTLRWLVAEGRQKEFRELHTAEFSPDECEIRLATIAWAGQMIDARYLGVVVQADELPNAQPDWVESSHNWLWWLIGLVLVAGGLGVFFVLRRSSKDTSERDATSQPAP